ncbi:MAG: GyrI-like domain-containing protein [Oscillospiraceae bacterium]|nr:GyrI-like domain-containing protein [Oscillospiraceae bacterium]
MAFDYKKEYKAFYMPANKPTIVTVPPMRFAAVRGQGDPNPADSFYKQAVSMLYAVAYTVKMSKLGDHRIRGFFDFVVPPLEGFWWQPGRGDVDYAHKEAFQWIALIRLPDFVTEADFRWAVEEASDKKKTDLTAVEFLPWEEGLCVQCMHLGPYDDEPVTVSLMHRFLAEKGYALDISDTRHHHEIYLNDARKTAPEKLKTVIRHPIRKG